MITMKGEIMPNKGVLFRLFMVMFLTLMIGCTRSANNLQETDLTLEKTLATESQNIRTIQSTSISTISPEDFPTTPHPLELTPTEEIKLNPPITLAPLDGKIIILVEFPWGDYYIEDITTGRGHPLIPDHPFRLLDWGEDGCTLLVHWGADIAEIDLQGNLVQILFYDATVPARDGATSFARISPDNEWVYYLVGTGTEGNCADDYMEARDCYYEYNDIETMSVSGEDGPYRLSQRGGAWKAAWSPDGQFVAFSDYDENGIDQLYIASRDGSNRQQLTFYDTGSLLIMGIHWSPDGERIALIVDRTGDFSGDATIVIEVNSLAISTFNDIIAQWWRNEETIIALQIAGEEIGYSNIGNIITVDTLSNRVSPLYDGGCSRINSFGNPSMVGCLTIDDEFYVINSLTHSFERYPQFDLYLPSLYYWIAAPESFPGATSCKASP